MLRERNDSAWISHLRGCPDTASGQLKYSLLSKLGKGRFGTVYLARFREEAQAHVAVKSMKPQSEEEVAWAASELQIMLTVAGHKNVLSLREAFCSHSANDGARVPADACLLTFVYATCAPRSVLLSLFVFGFGNKKQQQIHLVRLYHSLLITLCRYGWSASFAGEACPTTFATLAPLLIQSRHYGSRTCVPASGIYSSVLSFTGM